MKLIMVFAHLMAVCMALGTMMLVDLRLLGKVAGYRVVITPPARFEMRVVIAALVLLYVTGAGLLALDVAANPAYLSDQKIQGKILLVLVLTLNAFALHRWVFPLLERSRPVSHWSARSCWKVSLFVGLSNSLWMYCAFLGIARPWNNRVTLVQVLVIAALLWLIFTVIVHTVLRCARRDEPRGDWVDTVKSTLSGLSDFADLSPELAPERHQRGRKTTTLT